MTKKTSLWQRLKNAFADTTHSRSTAQKPSSDPAEDFSFSQNLTRQDLTGQVIVDLTEYADDELRAKALFDEMLEDSIITTNDIDGMLTEMGYHFTYHPPIILENEKDASPIHHFSMQVSDGERDWGCLLRFFEIEQLLAVYSIFPFNVPDTHRGEMLAVLGYLNYDLVIGNLELDVQDGEVRFKTSLDLEVTGLSHNVLSYLLQSNFAVTSRLHDTLAEVVAKSAPAERVSEAVDSLLANQQANTFYLMTDTLQ